MTGRNSVAATERSGRQLTDDKVFVSPLETRLGAVDPGVTVTVLSAADSRSLTLFADVIC